MPRRLKAQPGNTTVDLGQVNSELNAVSRSSPNKSVAQTSHRSIVSNVSAKSRLNIAKIEEKYCRKELELRLALMEAQKKVELAALRSSECNDSMSQQSETQCDRKSMLSEYLRECEKHVPDAPEVESTEDKYLRQSGVSLMSLINSIELPKVELSYFDGSASEYLKFIKQFEFHVETRTTDSGQRLMYLLHYCRGRAREAIDECILLPPMQAYPRARSILRDLFGQRFHVARSLIDDLLKESKSITTAQDSLMKLHIKMQNCSIALKELDYESDLNSVTTIEKIVRSLPVNLQFRWADVAERISTNGFEPTFSDLMEFISERSRVANSRFGLLAASSSSRNERNYSKPTEKERETPFRAKTTFNHRHALATTTNPVSKTLCSLCGSQHTLEVCQRFLSRTIEQRWIEARRLGACFVCLRTSHRASDCKRSAACNNDGCRGRHHTLLHRPHMGALHRGNEAESRACNLTNKTKAQGRLGILPVCVQTPKGIVRTYALLDSGSDTTLVRERFAVSNKLERSASRLTITTVNSSETERCYEVNLKLLSLDLTEVVDVDRAFTVADLPIRPVTSIIEEAKRWPHLKGIDFEELVDGEVNVLIGCDVPEAHWNIEQRIGGRKQPFAMKTLLGWVLCGPLHNGCKRERFINNLCSEPPALVDQIKAFYNLEFGDSNSPEQCRSVEDERAWEMVSCGTHLEDGHYAIPLPWRQIPVMLPNNLLIAERRLHQLRRRLLRDKQLLGKYQSVMKHHIDKGFLTRNKSANTELCWYLPHHPVFNAKKPDKIRVVFDCAAKFQGVSLNDHLLQGPDLTSKLIDVLMKFRMNCIAVAADIEEMFLQVRVPEHDQSALRVLWWDDGDLDTEPAEYRMTVHPFGAISSPFCANYALQNTVSDFGNMFDEHVRNAVGANFYVDDFLASFSNEDTARAHIHELTKLLSKAGFRLTKWVSNKREVLSSIPLQERAPTVREVSSGTLPTERTLGICWNAETDEFIVSFQLPDKPPTRRGVLSAISSLYDPLGFVSPWLLPGKILLQELCRKQLGWDEPLNTDDLCKWNDWIGNMRSLGELRIPRSVRYENRETTVLDFHIFCDASEVGYGAVVYACFGDGIDSCYSRLILSKGRVAPLKAVSIPRLELAAAVLAVRLWQIVEVNFRSQYRSVTFWTDSMIVLHYINNVSSRFCTFVSNRLSVIHDATKPSQWRHINSSDNPADLVSRGSHSIESSTWWLNGPPYLSKPMQHWPVSPSVIDHVEGVEYKRTALQISTYGASHPVLRLCERYSDWHRLLKATVWLTRFKRYLRILHSHRQDLTLMTGSVTQKELQLAEVDIIRMVQSEYLPTIEHLPSNYTPQGRSGILKGSSIYRLRPLLIDGLLCVGGRLSHATIDSAAKHPIILPRKHGVTDMIIRRYHHAEGHAGVAHVLSAIRQRYWILNGTAAVKGVIGRCMFCRRQNAIIGKQLMSPLPIVRVQAGWHPFTHVGLDYFGPIEVRRGRSIEKRYGCIITCLQSRAVHIDVAQSLTTDSFMMLLIRFIGRRGIPTDIFSDNGTNFKGADVELKRWIDNLNEDSLNEKLLRKGIQWHFNPPYASHRGGVWERLIRSIRRTLKAVCQEQTPNDETLQTFLVESERILNNRPIVPYVSEDPEFISLTPNDLILLRDNRGLPFHDTLSERYTSRWKRANYMATVFWKRWTKEYLPTLQLRQKWVNKERNFMVGDTVLVDTDGRSRNTWPLGVVTKCYVSSDGLVRTVDVRTRLGVMKRDIRRICLLEGDSNSSSRERIGDPGLCGMSVHDTEPPVAEAPCNLEAEPDEDEHGDLSNCAE